MLAMFREQPRAFYMIFMLEIWERFGYYTVQGILALYFMRFLGFDEGMAYQTFGAFTALVYGLVSVGGFLGDKILGAKRTIVLGLIVLAIGYFSLAFADPHTVYYALAIICVGNGLFKANPSSLLSQCYQDKDERLYSGFTLYYMAINLGSIGSLFIGPTVSAKFGYPYAFIISFIGILLGLANYWLQRRHVQAIVSSTDDKSVTWFQWAVIIVGIVIVVGMASYLLQHVFMARRLLWFIMLVVVAIYFYCMVRENPTVLKRMLLAFILMLEAVVFFTLYQQMPTSINLFAVHNVYPTLLGIAINPQSFQALNPIWIIVMSPVLAAIYSAMQHRDYRLAVPYKFAIGMTLCGISFLLLFIPRYFPDSHGMVSSGWLIASYFFQGTGELLVSALGVAMVAELVPQKITGFVMGMWFLTSSAAAFLGATVASFTALPTQLEPGMDSLIIYTNVFAYIGITTLLIALVMWCIAPLLSRLITDKSE